MQGQTKILMLSLPFMVLDLVTPEIFWEILRYLVLLMLLLPPRCYPELQVAWTYPRIRSKQWHCRGMHLCPLITARFETAILKGTQHSAASNTMDSWKSRSLTPLFKNDSARNARSSWTQPSTPNCEIQVERRSDRKRQSIRARSRRPEVPQHDIAIL